MLCQPIGGLEVPLPFLIGACPTITFYKKQTPQKRNHHAALLYTVKIVKKLPQSIDIVNIKHTISCCFS
jgi:hypothetical protein